MDTNRFAPPGAQVADIADTEAGVQPVRLWPPSGRIGRLRLLAYSFGLYLAFIAVSALLGVVAGVARGGSTAMTVIGVAAFVVYLVGVVVLMVQRSHDMDLSGWWSIAAFIPLVGLFWIFKGGTPGRNRWGAPPPPNGWAVRIFGLIFPFVLVIGIVAVVLVPAYQLSATRGVTGAPP